MKTREKGKLDLSEIKCRGKRKNWANSIGSNIYYILNDEKYIFKLIDYNKDEQQAMIEYEGQEYKITTGNILKGCFGNIIGTNVKDFRYKIGEKVQTIRKECVVLDKFRNEKGHKSYKCKCPDCGSIKITREDKLINRGFICTICSDKISYSERFMGSLLNQLKVNYEYQKTFEWSKKLNNKKLDSNKIYDFYIPMFNTIIEVNGELHYKESRWSKSRPLDYIRDNDKIKRDLAIENGVEKYIIINCMKSDMNYIKDNILNSKLSNMFDFSKVDWNRCSLDSCTSLMKVCSDLWNNGMRSAVEIAKEINLSKQTVITYLKKFSQLGLNDYNPKQEMKTGLGRIPSNAKELIILKDDVCLGLFKSATELERMSEKLYDIKLHQTEISKVLRGGRDFYKGYRFKYLQDLTQEERIKYNIDKAS